MGERTLEFAYNPQTGKFEMAGNQNPPAPVMEHGQQLIKGVQIGDTFIGGAVALVTAELISGLLGRGNVPLLSGVNSTVLANAAAAWVLANFGGNIGIPAGARNFGAKVLVFQALRDLVKLDTVLAGLVGGITRGGGGNANSGSTNGRHTASLARLAVVNA